MDIKKWGLALSLTATLGLFACGEESLSTAAPVVEEPAVSSSSFTGAGDEGLSSSSQGVSDESRLSSSEFTAASSDAVATSSAALATVSSSSENGWSFGDFGQACENEGEKKVSSIMGYDAALICEDGIWQADSAGQAELDECSLIGSTLVDSTFGLPMTYVCTEDGWEIDSAQTTSCDTEGERTNVMGFELVCKNGSWESDSLATVAGSDCDVEGETTTEEMFGIPMTYVCTEGKWTLQLDFGDDDWGDWGGFNLD